MPTYDYVCEACGHELEMFQSMSEGPKRKCPECSKLKLKRLIGTGAGFVFKGSGFYETDYRSESYKKGEQAAKGETKKPDSKKSDSETSKGSSKESSTPPSSSKASKGSKKKD